MAEFLDSWAEAFDRPLISSRTTGFESLAFCWLCLILSLVVGLHLGREKRRALVLEDLSDTGMVTSETRISSFHSSWRPRYRRTANVTFGYPNRNGQTRFVTFSAVFIPENLFREWSVFARVEGVPITYDVFDPSLWEFTAEIERVADKIIAQRSCDDLNCVISTTLSVVSIVLFPLLFALLSLISILEAIVTGFLCACILIFWIQCGWTLTCLYSVRKSGALVSTSVEDLGIELITE